MRTIAYRLSLLLIFTIPWEGVVEVSGVGTLSKVLGFVLAGVWLVSAVNAGRVRKLSSFHVALGLLVLWALTSTFWSADPGRTLAHAGTWIQVLALAVILWDLYRTRSQIGQALQTYVLGAYAALGGAVVNYLSGNPFYTHYQRFGPGDAHPDGFGIVMALGVPIAWYLASPHEWTISKSDSVNRWFRAINFGYIPAAFVGIALSGTRTAAIAALIGVAYGVAQVTRLSAKGRIAVVLALTLFVVAALPLVAQLRSFQRLGTTTTELTQGDLNGRLSQWSEGIESFVDHPVVGVGANMYRSVNSLGKVAHNSFVSVLVELGLIGFAIFGFVLLLVFRSVLIQSKWDRWFWLSLLTAWALGASTVTWEHRKPSWFILTMAVAGGAAIAESRRGVSPDQRPAELVKF